MFVDDVVVDDVVVDDVVADDVVVDDVVVWFGDPCESPGALLFTAAQYFSLICVYFFCHFSRLCVCILFCVPFNSSN